MYSLLLKKKKRCVLIDGHLRKSESITNGNDREALSGNRDEVQSTRRMQICQILRFSVQRTVS